MRVVVITLQSLLFSTKAPLAQKYGNMTNTQQVGRFERNEIGDLLGFNTGPVDSENPTTYHSI